MCCFFTSSTHIGRFAKLKASSRVEEECRAEIHPKYLVERESFDIAYHMLIRPVEREMRAERSPHNPSIL